MRYLFWGYSVRPRSTPLPISPLPDRSNWLTPHWSRRCSPSPLSPSACWRARASLAPPPRHRREWLLAALIAGIAPTLGYTAFSLGLVGYVTTLFRLSAAFTVVWSTWLLGETGLRRRLPGHPPAGGLARPPLRSP